jgi:hypothetical protein
MAGKSVRPTLTLKAVRDIAHLDSVGRTKLITALAPKIRVGH